MASLPVGPASRQLFELDRCIMLIGSCLEDEIALYDRQIRLWGVKAQEKIQTASILVITFRALAAEIVKNLVLAGVGAVTIADHEVVREEDLGAQFFLSDQHIGQNRATAAEPQIREMNPRVKVAALDEDVRARGPDFFARFDIVIGTDLDFTSMTTVSAACRVARRPSYVAGTHGFFGFIFSDLISHDFVIERTKSNVPSRSIVGKAETKTRRVLSVTEKRDPAAASGGNATSQTPTLEVVTKREVYHPFLLANTSPLPEEYTATARKRRQVSPVLPCLRALWEYERAHRPSPAPEPKGGATPAMSSLPTFEPASLAEFTRMAHERHLELRLDPETLTASFLRSFIQNLGCELAPVAAFLGGALAQDVINVLSAREQPLQNFLVFDGESNTAPIYPLHPFFPSAEEGEGDADAAAAAVAGPEAAVAAIALSS
ncbi:hypothetical protein KEM52_000070 [Ascosphaera acerosa]|nr:hypothetical protein KEM52_000070 [Ascosphaera acerosa]